MSPPESAPETLALRGAAAGDVARQEALLAGVERRARGRAAAVPTSAPGVKARLRSLGHPVTLFGEDATERRARLRALLVEAAGAGEDLAALAEAGDSDAEAGAPRDDYEVQGQPRVREGQRQAADRGCAAPRHGRLERAGGRGNLDSLQRGGGMG